MSANGAVSNANPTTLHTDEPKPDTPTWTVMIFMGVTTLDSRQDLRQAAEDDLKEIMAIGGGGDHCLNIFVQQNFGSKDWGKEGAKGTAKRIHLTGKRTVTKDAAGVEKVTWEPKVYGPTPVPDDEVDYRDGRALSAFIKDCVLRRSGHRSKDYSMLVLWGHAYDFTFGRVLDDNGGAIALNFTAISDVLKRLQDEAEAAMDPGQQVPGLVKLDVLAFDACDIATSELAYQLRNVASFLLASQVGIPLPGFPYHRILDRLKEPHGRIMSPAEFGSYAVRRFCAAYDADSPVSLTMLNLLRVEELFKLTQDVAVELATAIGDPETRDRIARTFLRSQTEIGKPFVDIADLCLSLLDESDNPGLVEKARTLGNFVAGSRPDVSANYQNSGGWPLVVDHDRNSGELVRLNGVSLYAPNVAPPEDPDVVSAVYRMLEFVRHGRWSGVAHRLVARRESLHGGSLR